MKKIGVTLVLSLALSLCIALAGCGGEAPQSSSTEPESSSAATETQSTTESNTAETAAANSEEVDITPADLANVDITIEYGDYDAMSDLSANIQNARAEGTVVQVDGMVVNYGAGMSYSIVEPAADGTKRIGTVFKILGASDADYPKDGQRAKITGIVGSDETGYTYFIKTLPEFVQVVG
jgi:ABC-type glycerol-3-phosphate transport system substrate-binding protein